jgi:hypothetical protein
LSPNHPRKPPKADKRLTTAGGEQVQVRFEVELKACK